MKEEDFLGLTKIDGQNKAESKNMLFRLIRIDDRSFFKYPDDSRIDRICVEIDKGKITKALIQ